MLESKRLDLHSHRNLWWMLHTWVLLATGSQTCLAEIHSRTGPARRGFCKEVEESLTSILECRRSTGKASHEGSILHVWEAQTYVLLDLHLLDFCGPECWARRFGCKACLCREEQWSSHRLQWLLEAHDCLDPGLRDTNSGLHRTKQK